MATRQDLMAGLLTGLGQQAPDPMRGMSDAERKYATQAQALKGLRGNVGSLFGVDTMTPGEGAQKALAQLDPTKKEDRTRILDIVSRVSPERVPALQIAFREQDKADKLSGQEAGIGQINPQFYTAESIQQYAKNVRETGIKDYSLLKEVDKVAEAYKVGQMTDTRAGIETRSKAFQSSASLKNKLNTMEEIMDSGLQTGALAGLSKSAKSLVQSLFPDTELEGLAEAEVFEALSNQLALLIRNPDSGMGLPGATSNRDLQFLIDSVPNLAKSPQGNKTLIKVYRKAFELQDDVMREQNRLIKENNGIPPLNLERRLEEFVLNYDVLGEELRNEVQKTVETDFDFEQDELDRLLKEEADRRALLAKENKEKQKVNPRLGR